MWNLVKTLAQSAFSSLTKTGGSAAIESAAARLAAEKAAEEATKAAARAEFNNLFTTGAKEVAKKSAGKTALIGSAGGAAALTAYEVATEDQKELTKEQFYARTKGDIEIVESYYGKN